MIKLNLDVFTEHTLKFHSIIGISLIIAINVTLIRSATWQVCGSVWRNFMQKLKCLKSVKKFVWYNVLILQFRSVHNDAEWNISQSISMVISASGLQLNYAGGGKHCDQVPDCNTLIWRVNVFEIPLLSRWQKRICI